MNTCAQIFAVISIITIVLLPSLDRGIFLPLHASIAALTFVAAVLCLAVGYRCTVNMAFACMVVFFARCVLYFITAVWEIHDGVVGAVDEWIILIAQVLFAIAYVIFTYVGWKRIKVLRAGDSSAAAPLVRRPTPPPARFSPRFTDLSVCCLVTRYRPTIEWTRTARRTVVSHRPLSPLSHHQKERTRRWWSCTILRPLLHLHRLRVNRK